MARVTIKSLEDQLKNVRELRAEDIGIHGRIADERNQLRERLKQIAAENETLRQDIKWYKSLIQHLVSGKGPDGQPR